MKGPAEPLVVGTGDDELAVFLLLDGDRFRDGERQRALRALDVDLLAVEHHIDAGRDGDGEPANT